uniref:Uncharacterized protein n=1 Tax=Leersia perrieri TaxID=77586 RepID=A0A0D9V0A0_9ORYZ
MTTSTTAAKQDDDGTDTVVVNIERMLAAPHLRRRPPAAAARLDDGGYSIFRVPANVDKKHYEPRLVSVGPYHRHKDHLRAMEHRKRLYLLRFLDAAARHRHGHGLLLRDCVDTARALAPRARACYFESPAFAGDGDDEFVEMLLLDGCFVVQFFVQWFYGETDPVFRVGWNLPLLHTDLLMLENQIPYFVLLELYEVAYSPATTTPTTVLRQEEDATIDHLLHLYHSTFVKPPDHLPPCRRQQCCHAGIGKAGPPPPPPPPPPRTIRCAKELTLHGVKFSRKADTRNILDVTFDYSHGILEIPRVAVDDTTCTRYMNLVAFEQCCGRGGDGNNNSKHLTSYVVLMDYLINTAEDVVILDRAEVVENKLANEEEAARFFNQLRVCSYIDYDDHYLAPVYRDVDAFCRRKWPRYKAKFRRDYLNSPWAIFGFCLATTFAVITLFNTIVTILKTFFHVLY